MICVLTTAFKEGWAEGGNQNNYPPVFQMLHIFFHLYVVVVGAQEHGQLPPVAAEVVRLEHHDPVALAVGVGVEQWGSKSTLYKFSDM